VGKRIGTIYLLHLEPAYRHAKHYLGFVEGEDVESRLKEHLRGTGGRLCAVAVANGCKLELVRTWPNKTRNDERRMKMNAHIPRKCPICRGQP
jgi:hypothetical protein